MPREIMVVQLHMQVAQQGEVMAQLQVLMMDDGDAGVYQSLHLFTTSMDRQRHGVYAVVCTRSSVHLC